MPTPRQPWPGRSIALLAVAVCLLAGPAAARADWGNYEGRPLADALRMLQARGLRIVFSSEIVTREMRVATEPRASGPLEILDELLKPHGLKAERGPAMVLQIVRAAPPAPADPRKPAGVRPKPRVSESSALGATYVERVQVTAQRIDDPHRAVGSETQLGRADLNNIGGVLADDPVRAVHALPRVAAADDFRSEFSVRGSPYRHIGLVVDGVATPWLQHAAHGRAGAGSLAMFSGDVLGNATLQAGAYPQRYGDWLGAQLGVTLRQGSRTERHFRASLSGTSAALVAEGPLGGAQRGSWLVAARHSYLDWPIRRRSAPDATVFGFGDVQAKMVYDVRPAQQLTVTMLGGRSGVDGPDDRAPGQLANGRNRAGMVNVRWDSASGTRFKLSQQAHLVAHEFLNKYQSGQDAARGTDGELSYRVDMIRSGFGGLFESGGQLRRTHASRRMPHHGLPVEGGLLPQQSVDAFDDHAYVRSAYASFAWTGGPRMTLTPGIRVSHSTLAERVAVGRWILGELSMGHGWTLNASAGVSHQFPDFLQTLAGGRQAALRPERAAHVEMGVAQRLGRTTRWHASIFSRRERDVLKEPNAPFEAFPVTQYENALAGSSRGVELLVERKSTTGISGWAGYSFGTSRYRDTLRNETFWADFDQRHAINVHARYVISDKANAAMTFRGSSNFPIPGYLVVQDDRLFAGPERNAVRLPSYARLDVRAERAFEVSAARVTVFIEVLNVLNRKNVGVAGGALLRGEAVGVTELLFPRLPSAGLRIEF